MMSRCLKATTAVLKRENAFARQTAATIARTDGYGSFCPKVGFCWQRPKRLQRRLLKQTKLSWRLRKVQRIRRNTAYRRFHTSITRPAYERSRRFHKSLALARLFLGDGRGANVAHTLSELFCLDAGRSNYLAPLRYFVGDKLTVVGWRAR